MRELPRPDEIYGDEHATEMVRAWIADGDLRVSLLLGMWADASDSDVDERYAWGELLGDLVRHIANGLRQSHDWPEAVTIASIRAGFLAKLADLESTIEGGYFERQ